MLWCGLADASFHVCCAEYLRNKSKHGERRTKKVASARLGKWTCLDMSQHTLLQVLPLFCHSDLLHMVLCCKLPEHKGTWRQSGKACLCGLIGFSYIFNYTHMLTVWITSFTVTSRERSTLSTLILPLVQTCSKPSAAFQWTKMKMQDAWQNNQISELIKIFL